MLVSKKPYIAIVSLALLAVVMIVVGAFSLVGSDEKATINDVAVPIEMDSGYRVVEINGEAPERMSHPFVTVVPYVVIIPGKNHIEIEPVDGNGKRESFYFTPEAGVAYRISIKEGGGYTLVEDQR